MIREDERLDEIGFGGLKLIQNPDEFCYGIDAVLLSDFASGTKAENIMDFGTGTGIIPLILSYRTEAKKIWGLELQQESTDRGNRSIHANGLQDRIEILNADVKDVLQHFTKGSFEAVVSNPPYIPMECGLKNKNTSKAIARHETTASLEDFVKAAANLLTDRGELFIVHRPSRLADLITSCRTWKLEPKRLRFVSPHAGERPNILLLHAVKGGQVELAVEPPLIVYNKDGNYTKEILEMYCR